MFRRMRRLGSHVYKYQGNKGHSTGTCATYSSARCERLQLTSAHRDYHRQPLQEHQQQHRHASTVNLRQQFKQDKKKEKERTKSERLKKEQWEHNWELTVGVEIHAELDTERKLFSSALTSSAAAAATSKSASNDVAADSDDDDGLFNVVPATVAEVQPNSTVALHDLAYPGAQPVFQVGAIVPALRAAIALQCKINKQSGFDRKHYFYADQPAGYQITQFYRPFAVDGCVTLGPNEGIPSASGDGDVADVVRIGIERVQLEQDTAKSLVGGQSGQITLLDFNRVSHPLIEIVSRPDMHSAKHASLYVRKVQEMLRAVGAVTAGMETGGLRADVNVSVCRRPAGDQPKPLGQRTEIKNLSSLRAIEDAIDAERRRQITVLEAGGKVLSETRGWTLGGSDTYPLRRKEGEIDYRYIPDPDLPPLIISDELVQQLKGTMPLLPDGILDDLQRRFAISNLAARTLYQVDDGARLEYLAEVVDSLEQNTKNEGERMTLRKIACNLVMHEIPALLTRRETQWSRDLVPTERLVELVTLLGSGTVHNHGSKLLLGKIFNDEGQARSVAVGELAASEGLLLARAGSSNAASDAAAGASGEDDEMIINIAKRVFAAHESKVRDVLVKGKTGKLQFFGGQVMGELGRSSKAKAVNPKHVFELVEQTFWKEYGDSS